jgi:hypothetical protein
MPPARISKLRPLTVPARCQRVEIGDAVRPEHDRLAIDDEALLAQLQRGGDDQREAIGPIITASADQAHAVLLADKHHAITVVLDLVDPSGAGEYLVRIGWEQKIVQLCALCPRRDFVSDKFATVSPNI